MADFDKAAVDYDSLFTHSIIGKAQRKWVWNYLEQSVFDGSQNIPMNILELNCGTGEDALWMASKGHKVTATDVSDGILAVAEEKLNQSVFKKNVFFQRMDLTKVDQTELEAPFDLIFSDFGGLNCIDAEAFEKLAVYLSQQLKPQGELVLVIMPQDTLVEKLFALKHRDWTRIKARKQKQGMAVNVSGVAVQTYFYNWKTIVGLFDEFDVVNVFPTGWIPSYLEGFVNRQPLMWRMVKQMEPVLQDKLFANWGDHYLLHLKRKLNN